MRETQTEEYVNYEIENTPEYGREVEEKTCFTRFEQKREISVL